MRLKLPFVVYCCSEEDDNSDFDKLMAELAQIRGLLNSLVGTNLMATLDDLKAKVAANTSVTQSAVTLIQGLKAQLDAAIASNDPGRLQSLSDALDAADTALAAAVTANTPAAADAGGGAAAGGTGDTTTTTTDTGTP